MPVYPDGTFVKEAEWGRLINSFPATYVIHKDGSTYRAEHTMAGGTDQTDTDLATLMQTVMDSMTNGGKIFLRYPETGQFLVTARMTPKYKHITIEGENPGQTTAVPSLALDDGVDDHMFFMDNNNAATFFTLKNLRLDGNGSNQTQGDGVHIEYVADVLLDHCFIYDFNESSVNVESSWGLQIRNSHLEASAYGIYINRPYQHFYTNTTFNYNTQSGLVVTGGGAVYRGGLMLQSNSFVENAYHGIFLYANESDIREVAIVGNLIRGNSLGNTGTYNGINIVDDGFVPSDITIVGNIIDGKGMHDTRQDDTQKYAIRLVDADDITIDNNTIKNNTETDKISVSGGCQNVWIGHNPGFVNENSGSDTITATSKAVAHGLNCTPSAEDIAIIGKENPTASVGTIWVDTIGAANFTVNVETDPGASDWDFGWKVQKHKFP